LNRYNPAFAITDGSENTPADYGEEDNPEYNFPPEFHADLAPGSIDAFSQQNDLSKMV
jgi:hypothetical protein